MKASDEARALTASLTLASLLLPFVGTCEGAAESDFCGEPFKTGGVAASLLQKESGKYAQIIILPFLHHRKIIYVKNDLLYFPYKPLHFFDLAFCDVLDHLCVSGRHFEILALSQHNGHKYGQFQRHKLSSK